MKTKLPSKIKAPTISFSGSTRITNAPLSYTDLTLNQLIDVVAELTTVVTQTKWEHGDEMYKLGRKHGTLPPYSPTLKETLLDSISRLYEQTFDGGEGHLYLRKSDVEAIINRLMP